MAEKQVQRRLAAILAADVVGYSRLMEQEETGTLTALKARRKEVLEPLVARHHGRIFKLTGDGVLVEFASAVARAERHPLPTSHAMPAAFSMESSGGSSWEPALAGSRSLLLAGSAHGKEKASNEANFPLGISAQARETKPIVCKAKPIPHQTKPFLHPAAKRGGVSGWQDPEQAKSGECHDLGRGHQVLDRHVLVRLVRELEDARAVGDAVVELADALAELTDREQSIIKERRLRDDARLLEKLGRDLGIGKERVRQIEHRALES